MVSTSRLGSEPGMPWLVFSLLLKVWPDIHININNDNHTNNKNSNNNNIILITIQ